MDSRVPPARLRRLPTGELTSAEIAAIRSIMGAAFGSGEDAFSEDDWAHSLGGLHFVLDADGQIVTHASVVERELHLGDRSLRAGYVEAVATAPGRQGRGFGTLVMEAVTAYIRETFDLGALGTGRHHFYERLGWRTWAGPAFVRTPGGPLRTPDDEGYILVLRTPTSPVFDLTEAISCGWRPGDAW
jgi:aminoglycoside 2'-N-acetyltransferase I